jgi:hypothetical protein
MLAMPLITFLIPVRRREGDLLRLAHYFVRQANAANCEVVIIHETNELPTDTRRLLRQAGAMVVSGACNDGVFHKTHLLNTGLSLAQGTHVVPYDSDLLPLFSLELLCRLVRKSPDLVLGGYRIMSGEQCDTNKAKTLLAVPSSAPEDCSGALYKQLMKGERFMVCPVFRRDHLDALGGWDENYRGWGCEDQDMLERYLTLSKQLPARLPDFVYLHFDHPTQQGWNEAIHINRNRKHYYMNK